MDFLFVLSVIELFSLGVTAEALLATTVLVKLQNQNYESRIRDLEDKLRRERESHSIERDTLNNKIEKLVKEKEDLLKEYDDLMKVKIRLDVELEAYRKLLESEESRQELVYFVQIVRSCFTWLAESQVKSNLFASTKYKRKTVEKHKVNTHKKDQRHTDYEC